MEQTNKKMFLAFIGGVIFSLIRSHVFLPFMAKYGHCGTVSAEII